jgi:thymidine kinase
MPGGSISLILGCMFASKSTALLGRMRRVQHAHKKTLLIKFAADMRYHSTLMSTHDRSMAEALPVSTLAEVDDNLINAVDAIFIDEGSFFPDLIIFCEKWANSGKEVTVASLDGTSNREPFGQICELVPLAERVDKLTAVCMCCRVKDASFTIRNNTDNANTIQIGGAELYSAACRDCWLQWRKVAGVIATHDLPQRQEDVDDNLPLLVPESPPSESAESVLEIQGTMECDSEQVPVVV